jgi:hypothetical protein
MAEEEIYTTQRIRVFNFERIGKRGAFGESFDDILTRLIDSLEKFEKQKSKTLEEEFSGD